MSSGDKKANGNRVAEPISRGRYYWDMAAIFDSMADDYDHRLHAETNPSTAVIRKVIHDLASRHIPGEGTVLDLGCGSGDDTVFLAGRGNRVLAMDLSAEMVAVARDKALSQGLEERVRFAVGPAAMAKVLWRREIGEGEEAVGVISSFGVLNAEPELETVVKGLAEVLRPGACVVATLMGRLSPWHLLSAPRHAAVKRDWGRFIKGVARVGNDQDGVDIRYWFPKEVQQIFGSHFVVRQVRPVGIVLPPPERLGRLVGSKPVHGILRRIDHKLASWNLFRNAGDHFVIVLERRG